MKWGRTVWYRLVRGANKGGIEGKSERPSCGQFQEYFSEITDDGAIKVRMSKNDFDKIWPIIT